MRRVVIGVPARNEAANIGELAGNLDIGASLLGEVATCELVLAYQHSDDGTLGIWRSQQGRVPTGVLTCPDGLTGKGRNVKLLLEHARSTGADLLLVDADLRDYVPLNVPRFVLAAGEADLDMVLPLWCRAWGRANTTNYLAAPLVRAVFGARVRQPLAGHVFLRHGFIESLDIDQLPDDYGIDIAVTVAGLSDGRTIGQVVVPDLHHVGRDANSGRIMFEVARTALGLVAGGPPCRRDDVDWPDRYWDQLVWPGDEPLPADFADILFHLQTMEAPEAAAWKAALDGPAEPVTAAWCQSVAAALRGARSGQDPEALAAGLVGPFFAHAEHRRGRARPSVADAEAYVAELGDRIAALLS